MFTIEPIQAALSKVKIGTDFPNFIREIKSLGVKKIETSLKENKTTYFNERNENLQMPSMYPDLEIAPEYNPRKFKQYLTLHKKGETDYLTFCKNCADAGIERWRVDLNKMTCVYFAKDNTLVYQEVIIRNF